MTRIAMVANRISIPLVTRPTIPKPARGSMPARSCLEPQDCNLGGSVMPKGRDLWISSGFVTVLEFAIAIARIEGRLRV